MILVKVLVFVLSSGFFFGTLRSNAFVVLLAGAFAIGASYFLLSDLWNRYGNSTSSSSPVSLGTLAWGHSAGEEVTITDKSGLDTEHARIVTKHTLENARAFCEQYASDTSDECPKKHLAETKLNSVIIANCETGEFVGFTGKKYQFGGVNKERDITVDYIIKDLSSGEMLDGSNMSGYPVLLGIFGALCPNGILNRFYKG